MATHKQNEQWRKNSGRVQVCWNLPVEVIAKLDDMVEQKKAMVSSYESGDNLYDMNRRDFNAIKGIRGRGGVVAWLVMAGSAWDFATAYAVAEEDRANKGVAEGWKNYEELYAVYEGLHDKNSDLEFRLEAAEGKLQTETDVADEADRMAKQYREWLVDAIGEGNVEGLEN